MQVRKEVKRTTFSLSFISLAQKDCNFYEVHDKWKWNGVCVHTCMCEAVLKFSHLKEDIGKFNSNAVSGSTAKGTQEVLLACIPAHIETFTWLRTNAKCVQRNQRCRDWYSNEVSRVWWTLAFLHVRALSQYFSRGQDLNSIHSLSRIMTTYSRRHV